MTTTITETSPEPATEPATEPAPGLLASLPGFRRPRAILPGPANPDPSPTGPDSDGEPGASDQHARGDASSDTKTSTQGFFKTRARTYAGIAETLLKAVGGMLNARTIDGEVTEAFLPDDDDLDTIPPPLGRLAARRLKFGVDPGQLSDIEDLGIALVGIAAWLGKGVTAVLEARRLRRRLEADKAVHRDPGDGQ